MAHELRGVELRLERAHEHIDALKHESRMFQTELPPPYGYEIPEPATDGIYVVRAKIFRPPSARLGILAADGAHNLRAALDMIAWELALKGDNPPPDDDRRTAFPICTHANAWESDSTGRMIERIPEPAVRVIRSFQPCDKPILAMPWHLLTLIQTIDNWSKHKAIPNLLSFLIERMEVISHFEVVSANIGAFADGDEICRVKRVEPVLDPDERFRSKMICHVGFSKQGPGEGFPISVLEAAHGFISNQVLPAFAPFFG